MVLACLQHDKGDDDELSSRSIACVFRLCTQIIFLSDLLRQTGDYVGKWPLEVLLISSLQCEQQQQRQFQQKHTRTLKLFNRL